MNVNLPLQKMTLSSYSLLSTFICIVCLFTYVIILRVPHLLINGLTNLIVYLLKENNSIVSVTKLSLKLSRCLVATL